MEAEAEAPLCSPPPEHGVCVSETNSCVSAGGELLETERCLAKSNSNGKTSG